MLLPLSPLKPITIWTNCLKIKKRKWQFKTINKQWHRHIFDLLNNANLQTSTKPTLSLIQRLSVIVYFLLLSKKINLVLRNHENERQWKRSAFFFCIQFYRTLSYCEEQRLRIWCQDETIMTKLPALLDYQTCSCIYLYYYFYYYILL